MPSAWYAAKGTTAERGLAIKGQRLAVCKAEGLVFRHSADRRLGHIGGDLGAFFHGLEYARDQGIDYVCKLSQRFVVDIPGWLSSTAKRMDKYGFNTATSECTYHGRLVFQMRTECVFMKTLDWSRPRILESLRPRELHHATEYLVPDSLAAMDGGSRRFFAPAWLTPDRHQRYPGVAWKDALSREETAADYARLFTKYGVTPGPEFNFDQSCVQHGYKIGLVGTK